MPNKRRPRRGSLQFWPRVRAKRPYARVRSWTSKVAETKPLGFLGYKAGMTHALVRDNTTHSQTKGEEISLPLTIIECPPLFVGALRFYETRDEGLTLIAEVLADKFPKELTKQLHLSKKKHTLPPSFAQVRLQVYSQPYLAGFGKKTTDIIEIPLGGKDP